MRKPSFYTACVFNGDRKCPTYIVIPNFSPDPLNLGGESKQREGRERAYLQRESLLKKKKPQQRASNRYFNSDQANQMGLV